MGAGRGSAGLGAGRSSDGNTNGFGASARGSLCAAAAAARACFRPDLYRAALAPHGADLPGASEKVEGALQRESPVASSRGEMFLGPDAFFDGKEFDPDCP